MTSYPFSATFYEGNHASTYSGSYITFELQASSPPLANTNNVASGYDSYYVVLDRANGLKRACSPNNTWSVYRSNENVRFQNATFNGTLFGSTTGYVGELAAHNTIFPRMCFAYSTSLSFSPPIQLTPTTLNLTLQLAFAIYPGDKITLTLPGFTNNRKATLLNTTASMAGLSGLASYGQSGFVGRGKSVALSMDTDNLTYSAAFEFKGQISLPWSAQWSEGHNLTERDSSLVFTAHQGYGSGSTFWVSVNKFPNQLASLCGRPGNYQGFKIQITSAFYYTNTTTITSTSPIGDGCKAFNYCSGNGNCNYCKSTCSCFNGFGSKSDMLHAISNDFLPDCSSRTCPVGPAIGTTYMTNAQTGLHRDIECSANGLCDRSSGTCVCNAGYEGPACEKMSCQGTPVCSGRGVCKPMKHLGFDSTALPLSLSSVAYDSGEYLPNNGTANAWDGNFGHQCVCDSRWPVGLGANQTQLAEYFGPACEFRRCPSGDDPITTYVNETNCYGVSQTGGADVGQLHNLCHVDCSNRGTCDYMSGLCTCFEGFVGHNCGKRGMIRARVNAAAFS